MSGDAVEVRLLRFPLATYAAASEHYEELMREFALVSVQRAEDPAAVPRRLLRLVDELTLRYAAATAQQDAVRDAALEAGAVEVDLVYPVPPGADTAAEDLRRLLEEADDYCRQGELLTLATPPDARRFRDWYFAEFRRQLAGERPTPWPAYAERHPLER